MVATSSKNTSGIGTLRPLLRRYPWITLAVVVTGVLSALAEGIGLGLFIPLLQSFEASASAPQTGTWFVDAVGRLFGDVPAERRLLILAGFIFGAVTLKTILAYARDVLYDLLDARVGHYLRSNLFAQFLTVGYRYWEQSDQDRFYNALASETWRTSKAVATLAHFIITACALAVYATLLLLISWKLTLLVGVVMGLIALAMRLLARRVERMGREATRANVSLTNRMIEGFDGMDVIRTFGRTAHEQERFDRASQRVSDVFLRLGLFSNLVTPVYELLAVALLIVILVFMLQTASSLPALLVFVFVLFRLQPRIRDLDSARVTLASQAGPIEEVLSLLDRSGKPYTTSGEGSFERLTGPIRFEKVTFYYDADPSPADGAPALHDATVSISAGETTALVGPSGAGKSTLIKLLLRFYDPTSGTVYVNDRPLPELDLRAWRQHLAVVSQDVYVFNTSVRDNIAYGRLDATDEEIEEAARLADAHEFISRLPEGYSTSVGDRGTRLSGGQRQRLALARAIVRDAQVLVLDEATNALDSLSEEAIRQAVARLGEERTIIIIAHRLSTVEHADHIIALEGGSVREQGTFEELMAHDGLFAKFYHLQYRSALTGAS